MGSSTRRPRPDPHDSPCFGVGALGVLGVRQPDGTFVTSLAGLRTRLVEMAATGEAVCVDGLASRGMV